MNITHFTKSQRAAISRAGLVWVEAVAQQFRYVADQGKRAASRVRKAHRKAKEALDAYRAVLEQAQSESAARAGSRGAGGAQ